jgi:SAM-dependent methyltransferase
MRYSSLLLSLRQSSDFLITSKHLESIPKVPLQGVEGNKKDAVDDDDDDASNPVSSFGTREYWDAVYAGHGDFPADEYSWYYGWTELQRWVREYVTPPPQNNRILVPGIGNDPMLVDLIAAGYTHITAQDYSRHALDRQRDLLQYHFHCQDEEPTDAVAESPVTTDRNDVDDWNVTVNRKGSCDPSSATPMARVRLSYSNVKNLPASWKESFTTILEKGLLDAVYLSSASGSDSGTSTAVSMENVSSNGGGGGGGGSSSTPRHGPLERAVASLASTLVPGGIFISVSGVVPDELRRRLFPDRDNQDTSTTLRWEWLRDGTNDLQAGCFVFRKL